MALTKTVNSKANMKQTTSSDLSFAPAFPVAGVYTAVSTAGQSTIANLGFTVDTTNPQSLFLIVDGKYLTFGATSDFTFSAIDTNGYSSSIQLNQTLAVGLNINAVKFSIKKESEFQTDNRFTQLYEAEGQGFQAFVNTANVLTAVSSAGTPAAGTFYSSIVNRAPIVDFTQDLKPRMGVERIMTQTSALLQSEFGANGESVWSLVNDIYGQIRFVGSAWANYYQAFGQSTVTSGNITDYVEIVFYGTGLNYLAALDQSGRDHRASVDGGAEGANIWPSTSVANVLGSRNYNVNTVLPVVSGLPLGVHTVKIRNNSSANNLGIYGFEILNQTASVLTSPGVAYNSGKKITSAIQSSLAYGAVATGARGGRVLHYLNSAGTIGQAWQAVNTTSALLTAADHTNEETSRVYGLREFGAGRSDDFSIFSGTTSTVRYFTLDDGVTSLVSQAAIVFSSPTGVEGISIASQNSTAGTFTFVGTGLDIQLFDGAAGGSDSYTFQIDNGTAQAWPYTAGNTAVRTLKIVSGLPYGTHTFRLNRVTASTWNPGLVKFIVYQPKKPTLPAGAVELADYCVLANYAVNATAPSGTAAVGSISTGVIRKMNARELTYVGSWALAGVDASNFNSALNLNSSPSTGMYYQYTFIGTGFEVRQTFAGSSNTISQTFTLDGSTNFSAYTVTAQNTGSVVFTSSTGTLAGTASTTTAGGNYVSVTGLAFGVHTIKITSNNAQGFYPDTIDIITPIYSAKSNTAYDVQSTLTVGSNTISDNRKISAVKDRNLQTKNISRAIGVTSSPSNGSTSLVVMPDMLVIHENTSGRINISFNLKTSGTTAPASSFFGVVIDGVLMKTIQSDIPSNNGPPIADSDSYFVSPGRHTILLTWSINSGTLTAVGTYRNLTVTEI